MNPRNSKKKAEQELMTATDQLTRKNQFVAQSLVGQTDEGTSMKIKA
jgi:hypothetical protein